MWISSRIGHLVHCPIILLENQIQSRASVQQSVQVEQGTDKSATFLMHNTFLPLKQCFGCCHSFCIASLHFRSGAPGDLLVHNNKACPAFWFCDAKTFCLSSFAATHFYFESLGGIRCIHTETTLHSIMTNVIHLNFRVSVRICRLTGNLLKYTAHFHWRSFVTLGVYKR